MAQPGIEVTEMGGWGGWCEPGSDRDSLVTLASMKIPHLAGFCITQSRTWSQAVIRVT